MELVRIREVDGGEDVEVDLTSGGSLVDDQRAMIRARTALFLAARQWYDDRGSKERAKAGRAEHREDEARARGLAALADAKVESLLKERLQKNEEYLKLREEAAMLSLKRDISTMNRDIARNDDQAKRGVNPNDSRTHQGQRSNPRRPPGSGERGGAMAQAHPANQGQKAAKDSPTDPAS